MFLGAAGCALLALVVWFGAFRVAALHEADGAVLWEMSRHGDNPVEAVAETVALLIHPAVYALLCAAVAGAALARHGVRAALRIGALLVGANLTTQLLKPALAEPRFYAELGEQIDPVSWPSGHATAGAAVALAVLLLTGDARLRALAFGGAIAVSLAVVIDQWHYPSDVLGGWAVAGAWFFAVQAVWPLPGSHSGSSPPLAPRERMKSRSESRLR